MPIGPQFVGGVELPWPEGDHGGPAWYPRDVAPVGRDASYSLSGIAGDHFLFSAAVLTASGVPRDPVEVYWAERGLPAKEAPLLVDCGRPVLAGLPPPFDRTVYACPPPHGGGLKAFLDRFAVRRPDGVWDSLSQKVPVVDWRLVAGVAVAPPSPPTVDVTAYGLYGPAGAYYWSVPQPHNRLWQNPVSLTFRPRPLRLRPGTT